MTIIVAAGLAFCLSWISTRGLASQGAPLSSAILAVAAMLGASVALALPDETGAATSLITALLGGLLLSGAIIDRQKGWAPDLISGPVLVLSAIYSAAGPAGELDAATIIWTAILGGCGFAVINGLWIYADRVTGGRALPPPADLTAIMMPVLLCGLRPEATGFYIGCSVVIFLCLRIPCLQTIFTDADVAKNMRDEITDNQERHAIAALTVLYPALWLLLLYAASHA